MLLLVALHVVGLKVTWQAIRPDTPLSGALFDYVLYIVLASPITSVVLSPGEVLSCMAMAWYMVTYRGALAGGAAPRIPVRSGAASPSSA